MSALQSTESGPESNKAEVFVKLLGEKNGPLIEWALEHNLMDAVLVLHDVLGLNPSIIAISNFVQECSAEHSSDILNSWQSNPVVSELMRFVEAFNQSEAMVNRYVAIPHQGSALKTKNYFKDVKTKTFLLAMLTNPLAHTDDLEIKRLRRLLRLWLVVQAAVRLVNFRNSADTNISIAARFLTDNVHSDHWAIIDKLLQSAQHFLHRSTDFRFTSIALNRAAEKLSREFTPSESKYKFVKAISAIANGESNDIKQGTHSLYSDQGLSWRSTLAHSALTLPTLSEDESSHTLTTLPVMLETDATEDDIAEGELFVLLDTDPEDTVAEQIVTGQSLQMQTAEGSHYLPWSWDRPLPTEEARLEEWLNTSCLSINPVLATGAALTWLAGATGRSLALILRCKISDDLDQEWRVTTDFTRLQRISPRRHNAWSPSPAARASITPSVSQLVVAIPTSIANALINRNKQLEVRASELSKLWSFTDVPAIETWFREQMASHGLPRLLSGHLSMWLPQQVFNRTGDHYLARMLSARPNAALPGGCSYASWDRPIVEKALNQKLLSQSNETTLPRILGSQLAPLEQTLKKEIASAIQRLEQEQDALVFHNRYAQYCVSALNAATGARYLKDPFDQYTCFDLDNKYVFINDKNDDGLHGGRIVPLPDSVLVLIEDYCLHLHSLADVLTTYAPKLARNIHDLTGTNKTRLPFFFLLDDQCNWQSMSFNNAPGGALFNWSLPDNLFRHRYIQQLYANEVPPEVVDGWMGHAERAVSSYGDYSPRCRQKDMDDFRPMINTVFDDLGFKRVRQPDPSMNSDFISNTQHATRQRAFGAKARNQVRSKRMRVAIKTANNDIDCYLDSRTFDELSKAELNELANLLTHREDGLAHSNASLRFRQLLHRLKKSGIALPIGIEKQPILAMSEPNQLRDFSIAAVKQLPILDQWAKDVRRLAQKSNYSKSQALLVATLLLSIEKRISYRKLLNDIATGRHYRIIQHKKLYFIEYQEQLNPEDWSASIQRHQISYKTASLLAFGIGVKSSPKLNESTLPSDLPPLTIHGFKVEVLESNDSFPNILTVICEIIEQANLVKLPGFIAASLSDRMPPTSLPLLDWLRLNEIKTYQHEQVTQSPPSDSDDLMAIHATPKIKISATRKERQDAARHFKKAIDASLYRYTKAQALKTAKEIEGITADYEDKISSALRLLSMWLVHLIKTGKSHNRKNLDPLAQSSVQTYFSTLSGIFVDIGYDIDLLALDSDEITEFYADTLTYRRSKFQQLDYFSERLMSFHRWARRAGLPEADWTDLDIGEKNRHVSAGFITELDYQNCLQYFSCWSNPDQAILMQFVMLVTYRFGLRSREAIGLQRKDWCEQDGQIWLLIRNNRIRSLKSRAGRRAIPLLFQLSELEHSIITNMLTRYDTIAGDNRNFPVLCSLAKGTVALSPDIQLIPQVLVQVIRNMTGNDELNLHHCRHSFCNRLSPPIFDFKHVAIDRSNEDTDREYNSNIRQKVLGQQSNTTRRSPMAMARLMGHAHPRTALHSYCHLLTDYADQLLPIETIRGSVIKNAFNTNSLVKYKINTDKIAIENIDFEKPTLPLILKALRLVALGRSFHQAANALNIASNDIETLEEIMTRAAGRIRMIIKNNNKQEWFTCDNDKTILLRNIRSEAWQRMLSHVQILKNINSGIGLESINDITDMISENKQILFNDQNQVDFISFVFSIFDIKSDLYTACIRGRNSSRVLSIVESSKIVLSREPNNQIDAFIKTINEGESAYVRDYCAVAIKRNKSGITRNSNEFIVAVLATAALILLQKNHST